MGFKMLSFSSGVLGLHFKLQRLTLVSFSFLHTIFVANEIPHNFSIYSFYLSFRFVTQGRLVRESFFCYSVQTGWTNFRSDKIFLIKVKQSTNLYLKCFPFFYRSLTKLISIRNLISRTHFFAELIQVTCFIAAKRTDQFEIR